MFTAWQTDQFHRTERVQGLKYYLEKLSPPAPRKQQTAAEMIAILRAIKAAKESDVN